MSQRKERLQEIDTKLNSLGELREELLRERRVLDLEQRKEDHPCSCVKLNGDIEIYDMQEQERRGRNPLGLGFVADCLTALKNCPVCNGTGVPGKKK